jgi:nicotinamidase-related amidase
MTTQLLGTRNNLQASPFALLLIDVINDLKFPEADQLLRYALPMSLQIAKLKARVKEAAGPVIYVNDNFGQWRSDFKAQVKHCLRTDSRGREVVEHLRPADDDFFVLKPKHSGFYMTALEVLLEHLQVHTLVIAGMASNICVLFTANDAYQRNYRLYVPSDCVAANTVGLNEAALKQMHDLLKAGIRPSTELSIPQLTQRMHLQQP